MVNKSLMKLAILHPMGINMLDSGRLRRVFASYAVVILSIV